MAGLGPAQPQLVLIFLFVFIYEFVFIFEVVFIFIFVFIIEVVFILVTSWYFFSMNPLPCHTRQDQMDTVIIKLPKSS